MLKVLEPPLGRRRLAHVVLGTGYVLLALVLPQALSGWILLAVVAAALLVEAMRLCVPKIRSSFNSMFKRLLKHSERTSLTGATYMVVSGCLLFHLFGIEVMAPAMLFHAVGDPVAAVVGQRARGLKLWDKSLAGPIAYVGTGLLAWGLCTKSLISPDKSNCLKSFHKLKCNE